jgi:hypothetical protein
MVAAVAATIMGILFSAQATPERSPLPAESTRLDNPRPAISTQTEQLSDSNPAQQSPGSRPSPPQRP